MKTLSRFAALIIFVFFTSACALFGGGGDEEVGTKNKDLKYKSPPFPFKQILISSADAVWQSSKTGSTIAINSLCNKEKDFTLGNLKKNILAGIENLKLENSQKVSQNGSDAERITALGMADGVPIKVSVLIFKKNDCNYDIAYIAREKHFQSEITQFEKFISELRAP